MNRGMRAKLHGSNCTYSRKDHVPDAHKIPGDFSEVHCSTNNIDKILLPCSFPLWWQSSPGAGEEVIGNPTQGVL